MKPPRLARILLVLAAPREHRRDLVANLDDEWRQRVDASGGREAKRWYWRQALGSIGPLLRQRGSAVASASSVIGVFHDVRYAWRLLARAPVFSAAAIAALALGIGATTATFSVVNAVLLRPLAYANADELVAVMHDRKNPVAPANFSDWRLRADRLRDMSAAEYWTPNLGGLAEPEKIYALHVTPDLLPMLGIPPAMGRTFAAGAAGMNEVVIAHSLWRRDFNGDPRVLGRAVTLDGQTLTIVGVMPASFKFAPFWATRAELWAPLDLTGRSDRRDFNSLRVFARLAPGVTLDEARTQMTAIASDLELRFPGTNRDVTITPVKELVVGNVERPLLLVFAAVGLVLLVACANVAHMLLARAAGREREVAVRLALGASRARLGRQFLVEGLLLSLLGGGLGLVLARAGTQAVVAMAGRNIPRADAVSIDGRAVIVSFTVAVLTAIVFGLLPARRARRPNLAGALREGERGSTGGRRSHRIRGLFVASEVALSLVLLTGSAVMIRSFIALRSVDPGFVPDHVLSMVMSVTGSAEAAPGRRTEFYQDVVARARAVPGVIAASAINHLPLAGDIWGLPFTIEGRPQPKPGEAPSGAYRVTLPGYFDVMRLPLLRGRDFTMQDALGAPGVMIVNEFLAKEYWPEAGAIGQRVKFAGDICTIVGVVKNAARGDWAAPAEEEFYVPYLQTKTYREGSGAHLAYMTLVVRTAGDPGALAPAVRNRIHALAPDVAVSEVYAMPDVVAEATGGARFLVALLVAFGGVAIVLASVGIYGVMSFVVSGRRQEIGIRLALGATPRQVLGGVVRDGMTMTLFGAAAGLGAVWFFARAASGLIYGVSANDALSVMAATVVLIGVAALACYVPASRASKIDPKQEI